MADTLVDMENRLCSLERRFETHERKSQEMLNRVLMQQERIDQVINVHSTMMENIDTAVETFLKNDIPLREWFMKQIDENRKFASGIIVKLVAIFSALSLAIIGMIKLIPGG